MAFVRPESLLVVVGACALLATAAHGQEQPNPLRSDGRAGTSLRVENRPTVRQSAEALRREAEAWHDEQKAQTRETQVRLVQAIEEVESPSPTVVPQQFGNGQSLPYIDEGMSPSDDYCPPEGQVWPGAHPVARLTALLQAPMHWFGHSDPNDPYRHVGIGEPLIGTSWRNRPLYAGFFIGGILNDDLIDGRVLQNNSTFLGLRLGADFNHYWGVEGRYAFARAETISIAGVPLPEQSRDYYGDVSLLYYPWGDARWRPYFLAGIGFANYRFFDELGRNINDTALDIPLGFGLKYYYSNWFTLRFDFVDNISLGTTQTSGMHNVGLMAGAEFRFGGKGGGSYFPWTGNTSYW